MQCPHCGFDNKLTSMVCENCGVSFVPEEDGGGETGRYVPKKQAAAPMQLAQNDVEEIDFVAGVQNNFPVTRAPIHVHGQPIGTITHENVINKPAAAPAPTKKRWAAKPAKKSPHQQEEPKTTRYEVYPSYEDDEPITMAYDGYAAYEEGVHPRQNRKTSARAYASKRMRKKALRAAKLVIAIALTALVVVAFSSLLPYIRNFFSKSNAANTNDKPVQIEYSITPLQKGDRAAHEIVFKSEEYESVYIQELHTTYLFTLGEACILIYDDAVIGEFPTQEKIDVTLSPTYYRKSGQMEVGESVRYSLTVPASILSFITPENGIGQTQVSLTPIQIQVAPGSIVTIGGSDVSDFTDEDGNVLYNLDTSNFGTTTLDVTVHQRGRTPTIATVRIDRAYMDIPIELSSNALEVTFTKNVTLSGQTRPGATLKASGVASYEAVVASDGSFTLDIVLARVGYSDIVITASMEGKEDSHYNHTIYYLPLVDEYSKQAWPMDTRNMNELLATPSSKVGKIYVAKGSVTQISDSEERLYVLRLSNIEHTIYIKMVEGKELELGKSYKIYCDFEKMLEGMPYFVGRYYYIQ